MGKHANGQADAPAIGAARIDPAKPRGSYRPTLTIVTGRPGSGKTTLARRLAAKLGCPLVSRDEINEGIFHTFQHNLEVATKEEVAALAFGAFFQTIKLLLSSNVSLVAEAAFQDHRWQKGLAAVADLAFNLKIILCELEPELARQRILRRQTTAIDSPGARRAALARSNRTAAQREADYQPIAAPAPILRVSTADGYEPNLEEVVTFVCSSSVDDGHGSAS